MKIVKISVLSMCAMLSFTCAQPWRTGLFCHNPCTGETKVVDTESRCNEILKECERQKKWDREAPERLRQKQLDTVSAAIAAKKERDELKAENERIQAEKRVAEEKSRAEIEQLKAQIIKQESEKNIKALQDANEALQMTIADQTHELGMTKSQLASKEEIACINVLSRRSDAHAYVERKLGEAFLDMMFGSDVQDRELAAFFAAARVFSQDFGDSLDQLKQLQTNPQAFKEETKHFRNLFWLVLQDHDELEGLLGPQAAGVMTN